VNENPWNRRAQLYFYIVRETAAPSFKIPNVPIVECKLNRRASTKTRTERGIYVKHFKNIPMADMELVLVSISSFVESCKFDVFFSSFMLPTCY